MNLLQLAKKVVPTFIYHKLSVLYYAVYYLNRRTMSQIGQDFWVFGEVFNEKERGFFVDVGAADGVMLSNTYILEKRYKWQGICIEANPEFYARLKRTRSAKCVHACVNSVEGVVKFRINGVEGSIIDSDLQSRTSESNIIEIGAKRLTSILLEQSAPDIIDYLSVDVEGAEDQVLTEPLFEKYRFNCMTIERPSVVLDAILRRNGYIPTRMMLGLDTYYIHELFYTEYVKNVYKFWEKFSRRCQTKL